MSLQCAFYHPDCIAVSLLAGNHRPPTVCVCVCVCVCVMFQCLCCLELNTWIHIRRTVWQGLCLWHHGGFDVINELGYTVVFLYSLSSIRSWGINGMTWPHIPAYLNMQQCPVKMNKCDFIKQDLLVKKTLRKRKLTEHGGNTRPMRWPHKCQNTTWTQ